MSEPALPEDVAALSFEEALKHLEEIVRELESGSVNLDNAVAAYERGTALKRHCEAKLAEAKAKIEKITIAPDGGVQAEPADLD